jgi:Dihydrodipicolinate synthase/N-acetylneuraminate lyase
MSTPAPFGRMLTAMVTPFKKDGSIDWDGVEKIADHLVKTGHDGIVVMEQQVKLLRLNPLKKKRSSRLLSV